MNKHEIAAKYFSANGNENIKELFVCSDGEAYQLESRALDHAREAGCKMLGGVTRKEWEDYEWIDKTTDEMAAAAEKEAQEAAEKEAADKAAKEATEKEAQEAAEKEAADKAAKEATEKEAQEVAKEEVQEVAKEEAPKKK